MRDVHRELQGSPTPYDDGSSLAAAAMVTHKWRIIRLCIYLVILSMGAALLVGHIAPMGEPTAPLQGLLAFWLVWFPCARYILRIERKGPSHE